MEEKEDREKGSLNCDHLFLRLISASHMHGGEQNSSVKKMI
jgi:hypothetical protein